MITIWRLLIILIILIVIFYIKFSSDIIEFTEYKEKFYEQKSKLRSTFKHELTPEFDVGLTKDNYNDCFKPERIIELNFRNQAGLTDRTGKILLLSRIACRLDAKIMVPPPCKSLTRLHNHNKKISCSRKWSDYIDFTAFKKVNNNWKKCNDSIFFEEPSSIKKTIVQKVTPDMLNLKYNTNIPFHWVLDMSEYDIARVWKMTNKTLPKDCSVERVFGSDIKTDARYIMKNKLPSNYIGLKIRMGDDISRTRNCTDPNKIKDFIEKLEFEPNLDVYAMMEPNNNYKQLLSKTLQRSIIFESDIITSGDNYERYLKSYYILEHSPFGRIEVRRLETTDPKYIKNIKTCSLRYFPSINSEILNSGFTKEFIDYDDI